VAATTAAGIVLMAGPANAAVAFDPTCSLTPSNGTGKCGFVGKGDVQTVLGYNNAQMQSNASKLAFTYAQPASQALTQVLTQRGSQEGTQAGTQTASQTANQAGLLEVSEQLSCTFDNGVNQTFYRNGYRDGARDGTRTGTRTGTRDGSRDGTRSGSRTGSRAGTLNGNIAYTIAYDPRVKNQINGFFLTSATTSGFVATGNPVWNAPTFGDYAWGGYTWGAYSFGNYTFGDYAYNDWTWGTATTWGGWNAEPGTNPAECNSNNPNILPDSIVHTQTVVDVTEGTVTDGAVIDGAVTDGAILDGAVTDGTVTDGVTTSGDVTPSGAAHLYVNGKALN
jgi:hypothetical protein